MKIKLSLFSVVLTKEILTLTFFFIHFTSLFAQTEIRIFGRIDNTTEQLIVYYSTDGMNTVESVRSYENGLFASTFKTTETELDVTCWVQECNAETYDSTTVHWSVDSTFTTLTPKLKYCDTIYGCDASITGITHYYQDWEVRAMGQARGANLLRVWDMGDGTIYYNKDVVRHKYENEYQYRIKFYVIDTVNGCMDSSYAVTLAGEPDDTSCFADFSAVEDTNAWNNIIVREYASGRELDFFWEFGDGATSNLREPSHTYDEFGKYLLCLTVSNDSCSEKVCKYVGMDSLGRMYKNEKLTINVKSVTAGLSNITNSDKIRIYPNPSNGVFRVEDHQNSAEVVRITDITGKEIHYQVQTIEDGLQVDISEAGKGVYFVTVETGGEWIVGRILIR